ncbi:hypothetical protein NTG1052_420059 [Candidatus Nitrotoga sp. 1052]|nr:hypothetical protein NTG1052_420059 [Candidatus Nitrotoga sp. 1052]
MVLALQQLCSPVFAQNSAPQQSEATSSKALPTVKKLGGFKFEVQQLMLMLLYKR